MQAVSNKIKEDQIGSDRESGLSLSKKKFGRLQFRGAVVDQNDVTYKGV